MASKVNTRFVLVLVLVLVGVVGAVAAVAVYVQGRSGESYIAKGDAKMAEGDYDAAEKFYSVAVNKEQQNVPWLLKWREAMMKRVPETDLLYRDAFSWYIAVHRSLAIAKKTDVAAHREYLDLLYRSAAASGGNRDAWDNLAAEADVALRYFDDAPEEAGNWGVLRRYRGLAVMTKYLSGLQIAEEKVLEGKADLEAAIKADPADTTSAIALSDWHRRQAQGAREKRDTPAMEGHLDASRRLIAAARAAAPRDPAPILAALAQTIEDAAATVSPDLPAAEAQAQRRQRLSDLKPALEEADRALRSADSARIDLGRAFQYFNLADAIDPETGLARAQELVNRVLAERPHAPDLLYLKGRLLGMRGEHEAAIAQYQAILDLPRPTVGFAGMQQYFLLELAHFWQATAALGEVDAAPDEAARAAALKRAETYRDRLEAQVAKDAPALKLINAKISVAQGNFAKAQKELNEYSQATGDAGPEGFEALVLAARVSERLGVLGRTAELYKKALDRRPGYVPVQLALADVAERLNDLPGAEKHYREVLIADPGNETATRRLELVRARLSDTGTMSDPIENALVQADRALQGKSGALGDPLAAIKILEDAIAAHGRDTRLVAPLVRMHLLRNDRVKALAVLDDGIKANPDSKDLATARHQLEESATKEGNLRLIDELGLKGVDRLMARQKVFLQFSDLEGAAQALQEAAAAPGGADDPRVVEAQFLAALDQKEFAESTRLADKAAAQDMDLAGGLTFRARVQLAKGEFPEAAVTLRQALEQRGPHPQVLRLLGDTQMRLGRPLQAIESYREAQRLSPMDPVIIRSLLYALAQTQQNAEALKVARDAAPFLAGDPVFANMRFTIEAVMGNRALATEGRLRHLEMFPDDADNAAALIALYIEGRQWENARALLDARRAKQDSLQLAELDASWHAARGGDIEAARTVWLEYLDKQPAEAGPEGYLTFGKFLLQHGRTDQALAAMTKAADFEDPKAPIASVYLADTLFGLQRYDEAEAIYDRLLKAGLQDPQNVLRARLLEARIQQGKFPAAEEVVRALGPAADTDLTILVLRAMMAERQNDRLGATALLDRAVERFPDNSLPYFRRALVLAADPAREADAIADLDTAIRLSPSYWQALQTRAALNLDRGRDSEALTDLRTAVETNPYQDQLRLNYLGELISAGREADALEAGRAAARLRPNDLALLSGLADAFAQRGLWDSAAMFYAQMWTLAPTAEQAAPLAVALLRSSKAGALQQADALLATPGIQTDRSPILLMIRAELRAKQRNTDAAARDVMAAYQEAAKAPRTLSQWYQSLSAVFPEAATRLQVFERLTPNPSSTEWLQSMRADTLMSVPQRREEGINTAEALLASTADRNLQLSLARMLQAIYGADQKYDKALEACLKGLAASPTDWMLNNNAAAYLAEKLSRPSEAIKYAEVAAQAAPANHTILDTLASAYEGAGERAKAIAACERALTAAPTPADKTVYLLRLIKLNLEASDAPTAGKWAEALRRLARQGKRAVTDAQLKELDGYERQIRAAR